MQQPTHVIPNLRWSVLGGLDWLIFSQKTPYSYHDETETASITSWFIESRLVFPIGPFEIFGGTILYSGGKTKFSSAEKTGARGLMEQVIMPGAISVTSGTQVVW